MNDNFCKTPLVSVVLPVYNGEKYLTEAIESILAQTYKNFEFIIVDDASTDGSLEIINKYAKLDSRVRIYKNKINLNIPKTLNKSFRLATGKYIAIMNQDDISRCNRLECEVSFLESSDCMVVGSAMEIIDENGLVIAKRNYPLADKNIHNVLICYSPMSNPSVMFKIDILSNIGLLNESFLTSSDYEYWFRVSKMFKMANLKAHLLKYRMHNKQEKAVSFRLQLCETIQIQRLYLFDKQFFSIQGLCCHCMHLLLCVLPARIITLIFVRRYYLK